MSGEALRTIVICFRTDLKTKEGIAKTEIGAYPDAVRSPILVSIEIVATRGVDS